MDHLRDLKPLRIRGCEDDYSTDVWRLVEVLNARGYLASYEQARELWTRYSNSMAAGWMEMDYEDADAVFSCISAYIKDE